MKLWQGTNGLPFLPNCELFQNQIILNYTAYNRANLDLGKLWGAALLDNIQLVSELSKQVCQSLSSFYFTLNN